MSKKRKPFPTCSESLGKLVEDVPAGTYRVYDVSSFSPQLDVFPPGYLDKCSNVTVATSGSPTEGIDWMVVCPTRVDGKDQHGDIDAAIVLLDSETLEPAPSGLIGYHQDFAERSAPITGAYEWSDYPKTVADLRGEIEEQTAPIDDAPSAVKNALHHMANKVRKDPEFPKPSPE